MSVGVSWSTHEMGKLPNKVPTLLFIFANFYIINLPTIIAIQFLDGVGETMAISWFYILLIDYGCGSPPGVIVADTLSFNAKIEAVAMAINELMNMRGTLRT